MILDGYLADRKPVVRGYGSLENVAKSLRRHLGDLQPEHLTKERSRFYVRQRRAEGHIVGRAEARRKKPIQDGTIIRELVTLRAALKRALAERWIQPGPGDRDAAATTAARSLAHPRGSRPAAGVGPGATRQDVPRDVPLYGRARCRGA